MNYDINAIQTRTAPRRCGKTWPRDPVLEVECPECHAPIGSPCKRPSEHRTFGGQPHAARDKAACLQGHYGECPLGLCGSHNFEKRLGPQTELTPEGEQYVLPGAEKHTTPEEPQGELW